MRGGDWAATDRDWAVTMRELASDPRLLHQRKLPEAEVTRTVHSALCRILDNLGPNPQSCTYPGKHRASCDGHVGKILLLAPPALTGTLTPPPPRKKKTAKPSGLL